MANKIEDITEAHRLASRAIAAADTNANIQIASTYAQIAIAKTLLLIFEELQTLTRKVESAEQTGWGGDR